MPKNPNYQNSLIYKIVCNDTNIKNVYIGSTTNFRNRKAHHKFCCNNEDNENYYFPLYMFIIANGGWDNWSMILVDYVPCNTKLELHKIERKYIEAIDNDLLLNHYIPTRTHKEYGKFYYETNKEKVSKQHKEYREANKDKIFEYMKQYKETNKDKIKEYNKEYNSKKIVCDKCGKLLSRRSLTRHKKSNRCIKI